MWTGPTTAGRTSSTASIAGHARPGGSAAASRTPQGGRQLHRRRNRRRQCRIGGVLGEHCSGRTGGGVRIRRTATARSDWIPAVLTLRFRMTYGGRLPRLGHCFQTSNVLPVLSSSRCTTRRLSRLGPPSYLSEVLLMVTAHQIVQRRTVLFDGHHGCCPPSRSSRRPSSYRVSSTCRR